MLKDWLEGLSCTLVQGSLEVEAEEVLYDSRKAAPGAVFVCMAGSHVDSHKFIPQVLKAGVKVLVVEHPVEVPEPVYHNLLAAVEGNLDKLHRYMALRKRVMGLEELQASMDHARYVGRSKEQVEAFLREVIRPVLEENKELLGVKAEVTV